MNRLPLSLRLIPHTAQLVGGVSVGLLIAGVAGEARAADTVTSLMADPKRLAFVQAGCKANAPWASEALCKTAAEARRRRFRGEGVPYTPRRVDPFASKPNAPAATPQTTRPSTTQMAAPSRRFF